MPILKKDNKIIYFSHIPKCGGMAIEKYCKDVGIEISFIDNGYNSISSKNIWNNTSPQHIDNFSFGRLFPEKFFLDYFTVVRNPIDRLVSAFNFGKYVVKNIEKSKKFLDFIDEDLDVCSKQINFYDNHFLEQNKMIVNIGKSKIFKIENGLINVKEYIDEIFFNEPLKMKIKTVNKGKKLRNKNENDLNDIYKNKIYKIYKKDFNLFDYDI